MADYKRTGSDELYIGSSIDTKPPVAPVGTRCYEWDTGVTYITPDGSTWVVKSAGGGGGGIIPTLIFTSSAATTTTITAAALADVVEEYVGQAVLPLQGAMAGEARYITAYNGTNQLTVSPAWAADPDAAGNITFAVVSGALGILPVALGTNGTTVIDSATTVLGAIGANNNNNAFASAAVVANEDGSVLEREQFIQEKIADINTLVDEIDSHLHAMGFKTIATGTFTTASTTVPADTGRTEVDGYWDSCWIVPTQAAGTEINQPRQIASYAQTGGVFTMMTGSTWLTAPAGTYKILSNGTSKNVIALGIFTTSSVSVPADTRRGEVTNYWNGCQIIPVTGAAANQPRNIALFTAATGVFSLPSGALFTTAPGIVSYVIVRGTQDQVAAVDTISALTYKSTIGNKADAAVTTVGTVASEIAYTKGLLNQVALVKAKTDLAIIPKATTIDLNQAAGSYDLYTGATQAVLLESLVIRMSGGAVGGAVTYISIQTNDATPQVIINSAIGAVANLTNEAQLTWHASFGGPIYIKVGQKIQLTIGGGAAGVAKVCDVVAEYKPVVAGGVLA